MRKCSLFLVFSSLFFIFSSCGAPAPAKTLREKLIDSQWSISLSDGTASTMTFYENNTVVENEGSIFAFSFDWIIEKKGEEEELVLIYTPKSTTVTMRFSVDEETSGFTFTMTSIETNPGVAYYETEYANLYSKIKLTSLQKAGG